MDNYKYQFDLLGSIYEDMLTLPFRKDMEIPSVLELIGDISGLNILDFGCGPGSYSRLLKRCGAKRVVGYDISDGMLEYARKREIINPQGIEYVSTLDKLEGKFDLVLGVYVLPYADSHEKLQSMVNDMVKLIRSGGRLITLPLNPEYSKCNDYYVPYGFQITSKFPYQDGAKFHLHLLGNEIVPVITGWYWSYESLNDVFGRSGLTNIRWSAPRLKNSSSIELNAYASNPHTMLVDACYAS